MIATPIMLLGLLGLLIWGGLWGWRNLTAPLPTPEPVPCVMLEQQENAWPNDILISVYNGGYTRGLAERVATHLRDGGYHVQRTTNTEEAVIETLIRSAPGNSKAMELVASNFVDATLDFDERIDGTIDVLVGTDFAGYAEEPWQKHPLEDQVFCKPAELYWATASPSPSPEATGTEEPAGEESPDEE